MCAAIDKHQGPMTILKLMPILKKNLEGKKGQKVTADTPDVFKVQSENQISQRRVEKEEATPGSTQRLRTHVPYENTIIRELCCLDVESRACIDAGPQGSPVFCGHFRGHMEVEKRENNYIAKCGGSPVEFAMVKGRTEAFHCLRSCGAIWTQEVVWLLTFEAGLGQARM